MSGVNQATIIGRVSFGKDRQKGELKKTQSGQSVISFSVATSEKYKDKNSGESKESTEWHNIVVWGRSAENCEKYLSKGDQVFIQGKIQNRKWDDKEGNTRYTTEVVARTVQFLTPKSSDNYPQAKRTGAEQNDLKQQAFSPDEIPF